MLQNVLYCFSRKNETIYDGPRALKETIWYSAIDMKSLFVGHRFLKQGKTCWSDWSLPRRAIFR